MLLSLLTNSWTLTAAGLFTAVLGMLYVNQDKMLYVASIPGYPKTSAELPLGYRSPADHSLQYDNLMIPTSDGLRLHAWFLRAPSGPKTAPTLVFFHANAGTMGIRLPNVAGLYRRLRCNLLIFDYRGYGISEGVPNETGLMLDADAVMAFVMSHEAVDPSKVVLFGRSLGGAVAMYVAAKMGDKIAGVIVENTFYNVSRMVDKMFSWLGVLKALVLRIYWPTDERIRTVTAPVLVVSGTDDEIVPHEHSKELYQLATAAASRKLYVVQGGKHNDCFTVGGEPYLDEFSRFMLECMQRRVDTAGVVAGAGAASAGVPRTGKFRESGTGAKPSVDEGGKGSL